MGASLWASTDDRSSVVAGSSIVSMMPGMVVSMMNAMASAMVALMMMPSLCGRDRESKSDDRE